MQQLTCSTNLPLLSSSPKLFFPTPPLTFLASSNLPSPHLTSRPHNVGPNVGSTFPCPPSPSTTLPLHPPPPSSPSPSPPPLPCALTKCCSASRGSAVSHGNIRQVKMQITLKFLNTVSVLEREEGYTAKYGLSPRELPRVQAIFHHIFRIKS